MNKIKSELRQWVFEECVKDSELIEYLLDNYLDQNKLLELEDLMVNNYSNECDD